MTTIVKAILSRVLTNEVVNQIRWQSSEAKEYGNAPDAREPIINEILDFMRANGIEFTISSEVPKAYRERLYDKYNREGWPCER